MSEPLYHLRPPPTQIVAEMASYGNGIEKLCEPQQPRPQDHFERRELNGIFPQPQQGLFRVGVHIPVGRLSAQEARDLAMVAVTLPLHYRYIYRYRRVTSRWSPLHYRYITVTFTVTGA